MPDNINELVKQQERLVQAIGTLHQHEPNVADSDSWLFYRQVVISLSKHVDPTLFERICKEAVDYYRSL